MNSVVILFGVFGLVCGLVPIVYVSRYFKVGQALKSMFAGPVGSVLRHLVGPILSSAIVLALTVPAGVGYMFLFAAPVYVVLALRELDVLIRYPDERQVTLWKMSIWISVFAIVISVHAYRANTDAKIAAELAGQLEAYKEVHGAYPATLDAMGASSLAARVYKLHYELDQQHPLLWYRSTFSMFDVYYYDFDKHQWIFRPD